MPSQLTQEEIQGVLQLHPELDVTYLQSQPQEVSASLGGEYVLLQKNYTMAQIEQFAAEANVSVEHFCFTAHDIYGGTHPNNPNASIEDVKQMASFTVDMPTSLGDILQSDGGTPGRDPSYRS